MVEAENSNMLSEGLILGVENLMKNIDDMREHQIICLFNRLYTNRK